MRPKAISFKQLSRKTFKTYPFTGVWYDTFGCPEINAKWFVYGESGNGKTSFLVQLAAYFTKFGKCGYVSSEEGISESMKQAAERNGVSEEASKHILIYGHLTYDELKEEMQIRKSVKLWILDSINFLGYSSEEVKELLLKHPKKMIVIVGWGAGKNPKGESGSSSLFMASLKVRVKHFVATANSRYGGNGQPFVIDEESASKYDPTYNLFTKNLI